MNATPNELKQNILLYQINLQKFKKKIEPTKNSLNQQVIKTAKIFQKINKYTPHILKTNICLNENETTDCFLAKTK